MKKKNRFRVCPICGARLDAGERCDCVQETEGMYTPTKEEAEILREIFGIKGEIVAFGMSDNLRE